MNLTKEEIVAIADRLDAVHEGLLYKNREDITTSVEIRHISGGKVVLDFSADCGKFSTEEMLDGYTLTAERLLMVLQHSDIITNEENYS